MNIFSEGDKGFHFQIELWECIVWRRNVLSCWLEEAVKMIIIN